MGPGSRKYRIAWSKHHAVEIIVYSDRSMEATSYFYDSAGLIGKGYPWEVTNTFRKEIAELLRLTRALGFPVERWRI